MRDRYNMEKRVVKRYTIGIKENIETRPLDDKETIRYLKEEIKKYNNNPKNPYFLGDFNVDYQRKIITFVKYKKLTIPSTLEEIDNSTINFNGDYELKELYGVNPRNPRELTILYRANNTIKTLSLFYKKNTKYLSREYVKDEYYRLARDEKFLTLLLNNKQIEYSSRDSIEDFDNLYILREELEYKNPAIVNISYMIKFYNSFISEGGKFNYFNFRLLASLLISYNEILSKDEKTEIVEEHPTQDEVFGQMMIEDILMSDLKDAYEEAKLMVGEGSLDEVYKHKLIPGKK